MKVTDLLNGDRFETHSGLLLEVVFTKRGKELKKHIVRVDTGEAFDLISLKDLIITKKIKKHG